LNNSGVVASFDTKEKECILMKVAASRSVGFDTLSLSHMRRENVTNVVYYSLGDENNIFNSLLAEPERCFQPAFFAAVLYRCHQQRVERFRKKVDRAFYQIEESSKFGGPGRLFGRQYDPDTRSEVPGRSLTMKLSYVQTELAIAGHLARASVKCGEWIVKLAKKDTKSWSGDVERDNWHDGASDSEGMAMDVTSKTLDEMEYVRRRAETVVSQLQGIQDRVQSQTTFVRVQPTLCCHATDTHTASKHSHA
jgi:hypothetical protein